MIFMGRAERRLAERRNRLDERKGKFLMSHKELSQIEEDISYRASGYSAEALMTCFALALSRKGFDSDDISDSLEYINSLMDGILSGECTMEDYMKELEEKTGIVIKCED